MKKEGKTENPGFTLQKKMATPWLNTKTKEENVFGFKKKGESKQKNEEGKSN